MSGAAKIGEYTVERELGRGAMGVVYAARHPEIPRPVAVKLLRREAAESIEDLRRFRREGEMLAKVRHPNVVLVHTLEQVDEGLVLVTDLVEGQDLESLLRDGPLPPEQAAAIVADLADGVAALHKAGVVHRDLKPANALITPDGTPVLIDFGLAREQGGEKLTRTGDLVGTPAYMSPEQALGGKGVGPAADVYGLGGILYALISGRPPFTGVGLLDVLNQITTQGVTPPSHHHETPGALESIVLKAMARKPEDRYSSAEAMRAALDAYLTRADASEPSATPALLAGVAVLVVSALALVAFAVGRGSPAPPATSATEAEAPAPGPTAPPTVTIEELVARMESTPEGGDRLAAWRALAPRLEQTPLESLPDPTRRAVGALRRRPLVRLEHTKVGGAPKRGVLLADDRVVGVCAPRGRAPLIGLWASDGAVLPMPRWRAKEIHALLAVERGFVWAERRAVHRVDEVDRAQRRLLWRIPKDAKLQEGWRSSIRSLAYAPRSRLLAVGGEFEQVYLIDVDTGRVDLVIPGHQAGDVRCLGFTADERYVITVTSGTAFAGPRIYELAALRRPPPEGSKDHEPGGGEYVHMALALGVSPSGSLLAVGNRRGQVFVLDAEKRGKASVLGTLVTPQSWLPPQNRTPRAHAAEIAGLAFVSEDRLLTVGKVGMGKEYHRNWVREWKVGSLAHVEHRELPARAEQVTVSPDRRLLLLGTNQGLQVWPR